ncbi:MAG: translocation/assembly module TamB domain-containing protein [Rhodospirillales bacterium]|nr:translocation/assembly module TamB domain-containing protein [Rhodospirillales bacterium]
MKGRFALRLAVLVLLALAGGLALAMGVVYGGLQTEAGRRFAVPFVERNLGAALDMEVAIDRLAEASLDRLRVGRLVLGGREDPWLSVTEIDVAWWPLALLGGRLEISSLNIERLALHRPPPPGEPVEATTLEDLRLPVTVAIGRLTVAALDLDAPVLGDAAMLALYGEATVREDGSGLLRLEIVRRDGPGGRLSAGADYALLSRRLDLSLSLAEPQGGLLARLLDLPGRPAVTATLEGEGSLDGWRGQLKAAAEGLATLEAEVDVVLGPRLLVALDGTADVAAALPEALRGLTKPAVAFTVKADWDPGEEETHALDARLASDAADVLLRATIDGRTLKTDGQAFVRVRDPGVLALLTAPVAAHSAEATATLEGTLTRPAGRLDARVENLTLPGGMAERAVLTANYAFTEGFGGPATVDGWLRFVELTLEEKRLEAMVGDDVRLEADGRILANGDVEVKAARLRMAGGDAALSGTFAVAGRADFAGSLQVPDLAYLQGLLGMPVGGNATVTTALHLADGAVRGTVTANLDGLVLPETGAAASLLGSNVAMAAEIARDRTGTWQFDSISLDGGDVSAAGRAVLAADLGHLDGAYRVRLADLSPLSAQAGIDLAGGATLEGTVAGATAAPSLRGRLTAEGLRVAGQPWRDFGIDYRVDDALTRPRGRLAARVEAPWDTVSLAADLAQAEDGRLALRNIAGETLGSRLSGAVILDLASGVADGRLTATAPQLRSWSGLAGLPLAGSLGMTLSLSPDAGRQDILLDVEAKRPRIAPVDGEMVAADGITAKVVVGDVLGERRIDGRLRVAGLTRKDMRLTTVEARARGGPERLDISFTATGTPLSAEGAGSLAVAEGAVVLTMNTLSGRMQERPFALDRPARLRIAGDDLALGDLRLRVGDGVVEGDLKLGGGMIDLVADLRRLPLSLVPGQMAAGTLDGEVRLSGSAAAPNGRLRLSTMQATVSVAGEPMAMRARAEGALAGGMPTLKVDIEGPGGSFLVFDGRLPVRISAAPFAVVEDKKQSLSASLRGQGDLAVLLGSLVPDPHRLVGRLDLAANFSGSLSDPRAEGHLRIEDGRYENLVSGTLIGDVVLDARIERDTLNIVRASGLAGTGRIEGSGTLGLSPTRDFPLDLVFKADKAGIVHRDDVSATASGEIVLTGPVLGPAIKGKLTVDEAEVRLVDRMPPDVVALDVVEVNGPTAIEPVEAAGGSAPPGATLDLAIAIPNRLFVRGRGLESEWSGAFRLTGPAAEPRVTGQVKPVRGEVSFAGKTFHLQQASTVAFRDPASTIPVLDVTAEYRGDDFSARFHISGRADDPKVTLSSVPEMPQDEIVSRILFGRGVSRISAIEAAQLAQTVASLSGSGGLGILETARRALGVDVLRVDAGEKERGPALTAGRYLSKDVYVGVSQGAGAKSGEATVEVEVAPNVTIETEVGPTSGSQIGARWKLDY